MLLHRCVSEHPLSRGNGTQSRRRDAHTHAHRVHMTHDLVAACRPHTPPPPPTTSQVNPFGKVPALSDGDLNLFESGGGRHDVCATHSVDMCLGYAAV